MAAAPCLTTHNPMRAGGERATRGGGGVFTRGRRERTPPAPIIIRPHVIARTVSHILNGRANRTAQTGDHPFPSRSCGSTQPGPGERLTGCPSVPPATRAYPVPAYPPQYLTPPFRPRPGPRRDPPLRAPH